MNKVLSKEYWLEKDIQKMISNILRYGVLTSALFVISGGIIFLANNAQLTASYAHLEGATFQLRNLAGIIAGVKNLQGDAIIQLGVVILIATPIARIVFSVFAFAIEKDYLYVVITVIVLFIIIFSIFSGNA